MRLGELLRNLDWVILGTSLLLVGIGFAMIVSATYDQGFVSTRFYRQLAALGIAMIGFLVIARTPYFTWRRFTPALYMLGLLGLLVVAVTAEVIRGSASRIDLFAVQIQPSEYMKVALLVMLAHLLSKKAPATGWFSIAQSAALVSVPVGLTILEPDMGMAALMMLLWAALIVFIGTSWKKIALLSVLGIFLAIGSWYWLLADYQRTRIQTFIDPGADPLGSGYNITQSMVAFGSGRLVGRGLGHGPQSQLKFLPEQHTDFILASIGEELGFVGVTLVIILYGVLLVRVLKVAQTTQDSFGRLIAAASYVILFVSFTISAGMNMGLLPVTGIPLPLVSYGGSNLISTFLILGLVQSVHLYSHWNRRAPDELTHFS